MEGKIQKITTFLWFDNNAEEAASFYTSVFKDSKILQTIHYAEGMPGKAGTVMTIDFLLNGQKVSALNGGPIFKFNESISLVVNCEGQEEIDYFWKKLCEGGSESACGWLKDKFGLSWQIIPANLNELLDDRDAARSQRVMEAIMKMRKLDVKTLEKAYDNNQE
jgi:predicted 3-demethylubiquinone-9 3-methyltransferase (glyoxalase superfamily)